MEPPKGPVRQIMGGAIEYYGIWKFAKNKEGAIEFLKYYADHWPEAFKASEGYNNPCFANLVPKPMPILSNDPTSTPHDKLAILQDSEAVVGLSGISRPSWPAVDEVYNDFVICDMMAKAATGQMSAEDAVKWAHATVRSHLQEVARESLINSPDRASSAVRARRRSRSAKHGAPPRIGGGAPTLNSGRFDVCGIGQGYRQEIRRGPRRQRHFA